MKTSGYLTANELDALCATEIMGWTLCEVPGCNDMTHQTDAFTERNGSIFVTAKDWPQGWFSPSSDLRDAWAVMDKVTAGDPSLCFNVCTDNPRHTVVYVHRLIGMQLLCKIDRVVSHEVGETAPQAIVQAVLRAKGFQVGWKDEP
jgi:hypothetical protein